MRLKGALVVALIIMTVAQLVIPSASAWLWPIFSFQDYCHGYPINNKPLPGTPQWPFFPDSGRAELVPPGVAYCPVRGSLNFGPAPPMMGGPYVLPGINRTAGQGAAPREKNVTENASAGK